MMQYIKNNNKNHIYLKDSKIHINSNKQNDNLNDAIHQEQEPNILDSINL